VYVLSGAYEARLTSSSLRFEAKYSSSQLFFCMVRVLLWGRRTGLECRSKRLTCSALHNVDCPPETQLGH